MQYGVWHVEESIVRNNRRSIPEVNSKVYFAEVMGFRPPKLLAPRLLGRVKLCSWAPHRDDEIRNLCEHGQLCKALMLMDGQDMVCSVSVYKALLNACVKKRTLAQAKRVHAHLAKHGLETSRSLGEHLL